MAVSATQIVKTNPMGFAHPAEKGLIVDNVNNPMNVVGFRNTFSLNGMQAFLQGQNPTYYTDAQLLSMTANDMVYATRMFLNQV